MKDKKMSMKASILWNSWGSMFYLGCQWLLSILVIRLSGFDNSGILTLAMSITNMFYSIAVYGMRTFQVADQEGEFGNAAYISSRVVTCTFALILCIGFVLVNRYRFVESLSIILYMCFRVGEAMFDVYAGFYQKHWRMDCLGKSMVYRGMVMVASYGVILGLTGSLPLTFLGMTISTGFVILLYDRRKMKEIIAHKWEWVPQNMKRLLLKCLPLVGYLFLNAGITSIPRYFLEKMSSTEELGIYAAIAAPTLVVQMASTYIFNPFVAAFAERYSAGDKKGFWKLFYTCLLAVGIVAAGSVGGGLLFGKWGLRLLIGEKIIPYTYLLMPLIFCTVFTAFSWLLCGVLTVVKDFKGLIISNLTAVFVSAAGAFVFIPIWGMQGTSFASILALLIEIVLLFYYLYRNIGK